MQAEQNALRMLHGEIGLALARDRVGRSQGVVPRVAVAHPGPVVVLAAAAGVSLSSHRDLDMSIGEANCHSLNVHNVRCWSDRLRLSQYDHIESLVILSAVMPNIIKF